VPKTHLHARPMGLGMRRCGTAPVWPISVQEALAARACFTDSLINPVISARAAKGD
jgi:hypothetical protein